ncbi:hypothetical protein [Streptomyces sp. NPDC053431]|uniref:hypothetical protein n=1 Tax=Streptomyces sp. NPDC053431 TaxID=3365703 RepID=UPI0037D7B7C4
MSTALRLVRRLLTAVLLSAAISVGPVALSPLTALLPRAAAASLTLDPATGPPGRYVTLHGSFPACGEATVTFDGAGVGGAVHDPDTQELDGSFTVPQDAQPGPHPVTVTCRPEGTSASASFTVTGEPDGGGTTTTPPPAGDLTLRLVPDHASIGDVIDVQGTGFDACSPRTVDLYVVDGPDIASGIEVSETGHFSYQETVPDRTAPDTYTFRAACSADPSLYADADLVVGAPAQRSLALDPGQGTVGTTVTANGSGFSCPEVQLLWDGSEQLATTLVDASGTFGTDFPVPTGSAEGAHPVRAVCTDDPEQYADATFTLTPTGGGTDNGGTQNGGNQNGGTDNGGTDNGGTQNGGTNSGGGTDGGGGGGGGGSATPVGVVVGSTTGAAFALAAAAAVYFGRLHRGPRWVHKHVRAALRPAGGATELIEDRGPGEPPTHTTRLDPHPDPGRQTLDEEER